MKPSPIAAGIASIMASISVWVLGVQAGPRDYPRTLRITCVNNLKQVGLSLRQWELDNMDQFPYCVPTNQGGSMEFCDRGDNGEDRGSYMHFMVMSNELGVPLVLKCPEDRKTKPAETWAGLKPENITYHLRTSVTNEDANSILIVCPVCGARLKGDASVTGPTWHPRIPRLDSPDAPWSDYYDLFRFSPTARRSAIIAAFLFLGGIGILIAGFTMSRRPSAEHKGI